MRKMFALWNQSVFNRAVVVAVVVDSIIYFGFMFASDNTDAVVDFFERMKNVAINIISYVTRKGKFRVVV